MTFRIESDQQIKMASAHIISSFCVIFGQPLAKFSFLNDLIVENLWPWLITQHTKNCIVIKIKLDISLFSSRVLAIDDFSSFFYGWYCIFLNATSFLGSYVCRWEPCVICWCTLDILKPSIIMLYRKLIK